MLHATSCQFCKLPITLEIEDGYAGLGDPHKLIPMASCNHCADLRVCRRTLEGKLRTVCRVIQMSGQNATDTLKSNTKKSLTRLTQDYAKMIARWHRLEGMAWDEECVNQLMEHPEQWGEIVSQLWKTFKHSRPT